MTVLAQLGVLESASLIRLAASQPNLRAACRHLPDVQAVLDEGAGAPAPPT
jgi:hypothetical protein